MASMQVDFLVEEQSMEGFLHPLLSRWWPELAYNIVVFQGKQDMLAKLPRRLLGYRYWLPDDHVVMVVVDKDDDQCIDLKNRLDAVAAQAELTTLTENRDRFQVANRIVVTELESWYFGDWEAVRAAYPRIAKKVTGKAGFRDPDRVVNPWETLERKLQRAGYFRTGLRKLELAKTISPHIDPARNRSPSFRLFCRTLDHLV